VGNSSGHTPSEQCQWANAFAAYLIYEATDRRTFANRIDSPMARREPSMLPGSTPLGATSEEDKLLAVTFSVSYCSGKTLSPEPNYVGITISDNMRMSDDGNP
jgi:hypothetical protein